MKLSPDLRIIATQRMMIERVKKKGLGQYPVFLAVEYWPSINQGVVFANGWVAKLRSKIWVKH